MSVDKKSDIICIDFTFWVVTFDRSWNQNDLKFVIAMSIIVELVERAFYW